MDEWQVRNDLVLGVVEPHQLVAGGRWRSRTGRAHLSISALPLGSAKLATPHPRVRLEAKEEQVGTVHAHTRSRCGSPHSSTAPAIKHTAHMSPHDPAHAQLLGSYPTIPHSCRRSHW